MSSSSGDNSNCWWFLTMLYPIVKLQCVRLWIILVILMFLNCILSSYLGYNYSYILRQEFQWRWNMSRFTHIAFVSFFWWIYRILIMYIVLFLYLYIYKTICVHWILLWIHRCTWTHWCTMYIGQQFYNVHRIMRQEIGQLGRWSINNFTNKNIQHYGYFKLFLMTIKHILWANLF